jgi:hypothetical protein
MKTRIIVLLFFGKICLSLGQSVTITPSQAEIKSTNIATELEITNYGGNANIVGRSSGGTYLTPTNTLKFNQLFRISAAGYIGGLTPFYSSASIDFVASENWTNTHRGTDMFFRTTENGVLGIKNRMVISNNGNVGIGIDNPAAPLHISDNPNTILTNGNGSTNVIFEGDQSTRMLFINPTNKASGIIFGNSITGIQNGSIIHDVDSTLKITSGFAQITLDSKTGNIGINDNNPKANFTINGDFAISKKLAIVGPSSTYNNFARNSHSVIAIGNGTGQAEATLSGLSDGDEGIMVYIYVRQGSTLILQNEGLNSLANNRILTHTNSNVTFVNNGGVTLMYDKDISRWRVISVAN